MQSNPQELSWQAIQSIVGVKLPTNVLLFDEIGFHLIKNARSVPNVIDLDSDVEIVENDRDVPLRLRNGTENRTVVSPQPDEDDSEEAATGSEGEENSNWSCSACDAKFDTQGALTEHGSSAHADERETENSGDNTLSIDDYLEVTLSTDSDASHICSRCNQIFSSEVALASHACSASAKTTEGAVTAGEERKYPCHMCAEKFPSYWELRKHINTHFPGMLDSKSSFCHLCQKDYTKTGFMNHLRKHTGERPFVCELCHKAFSQSSSLSIHMKFHLNVRKHACSLCEKKFVTKSELSRHMTVHTKQKSYYCGVCDKAFTRSDNMKKHEKTHG